MNDVLRLYTARFGLSAFWICGMNTPAGCQGSLICGETRDGLD